MAEPLGPGLYEVLVSAGLAERLTQLDEALTPVSDALLDAEAADRLALHLSQIIEREIRDLPERERAVQGAEITRALLRRLAELTGDGTLHLDEPVDPASVLRSIAPRRIDGSIGTVPQPLIPLLDTTLLTNAPSEPRVGQQLLTEIESADRIDLLVAFVRRSGIAPFVDALRRHCAAGRRLRVLTTTYTNSTEQA
ncbi:helicase, partial [cyanobacterium TDX16]